MILIRPGCDIEIETNYRDDIGRLLILSVKIQETSFKLVNIYSPNYEDNQVHFFNWLSKELEKHMTIEDRIIIGGDFNTILNPHKDRKSNTPFTRSTNHKNIIKTLNKIKTTWDYMIFGESGIQTKKGLPGAEQIQQR